MFVRTCRFNSGGCEADALPAPKSARPIERTMVDAIVLFADKNGFTPNEIRSKTVYTFDIFRQSYYLFVCSAGNSSVFLLVGGMVVSPKRSIEGMAMETGVSGSPDKCICLKTSAP